MRKWTKITVFIAVMLTVLLGLSLLAAAASPEEKEAPGAAVRVAFPDSPGLSETHEDGTRSGVFYDWFVELAKYTGWEYEFVEGEPEELIQMVRRGELDLMSGMFYSEILGERYNFPNYSVGYSNSLLIKRKDDTRIQSFDLSTLKGKTIGVFSKSISKIEQLEYFLSYNSVTCDLRYYDDAGQMEDAFARGDVDLLLGGDSYLSPKRSVATRLGGEPYYIVTSKMASELYGELDEAITNIYMADPNFAIETQTKYFPEYYDSPIVLTDQDLAYIEKTPPVRVALIEDSYPLSYQKKEIHEGICQDTFTLISNQTGMKFEFVYADDYQGMFQLVSDGKADIIGSFMDDERMAQDKDMVLTKSYVSLDEVILKNKKSSYPSDDLTLALVEGRDIARGIVPQHVKHYAKFADCVNAVERGDADATIIPSAFVDGLFFKNYYTQVTIVMSNNCKSHLSIAFPKPVNVPLFSIINKAINSIPAGEMDSVVSKNLVSAGENNISLKAVVYANPMTFVIVFAIFLVLVGLLLLLYGRFRLKNELMQAQLQKARESSQAKSEFLSQMSHEIRTPMNAIIGLTQIALRAERVPPQVETQLEEIETTSQFLLSLVSDILDMSKIESSKMKLNQASFKPRALIGQAESMMRVQAEKLKINLTFSCEMQDEYFVGDALRIKQVVINLLSNALKFTKPDGNIIVSLTEVQRKETQAELRFSVKDDGIGIERKDLDRIFQSFEQSVDGSRIGQSTGLGLSISSNLVRLMGGELSVTSMPGHGSDFFFSVWLPYGDPPEQKAMPVKRKYDIKGMRILLAEDNDLNAKIVIFMLEDEGVLVERASDGQQAVDLFAGNPEGYYNLILMDIQMPVKSGLAATEEIRRLDRPDARTVPIIAMTANTFKEDQEKALDSGMDGFIPKPFQVEQLYKVIESR